MTKSIIYFTRFLFIILISFCFSSRLEAYEVKLDWAKQIKGNTSKIMIKENKYGEIILAGDYRGKIIFDDNHTYTGSAASTVFMAKINKRGDILWYKQFDGGSLSDTANCKGLALDSLNGIFICGDIAGTINFPSKILQERLFSSRLPLYLNLMKMAIYPG